MGGLTFLASLHLTDAILKIEDVPPSLCRASGDVEPGTLAEQGALTRRLDVQTASEGAVPGAGQDHSADLRVLGQPGEDLAQLHPHLLEEGVEPVGPVDLDGRDILGGRRDEEVLEARVPLPP